MGLQGMQQVRRYEENIQSRANTTEFDVRLTNDVSPKVQIILSEYERLREELMYFINAQRQNMAFLITTAFGQFGGLILLGDRLDPKIIIYGYLFGVPFLIFIMMIRSIENTMRVLVVADYIYNGIKPQLKQFFDEHESFFEWEDHKVRTQRFSQFWIMILDSSKWWVFYAGIALSYAAAITLNVQTNGIEPGELFQPLREILPTEIANIPDVFVIAAVTNILFIFVCLVASAGHHETGEGNG